WRDHARTADSDSHFKQPARITVKAPPPLFSQGAGSAGISIPSAHEGECSLTKCEGSGAPKGAGNISNALRRTPIALGVHLAALHCGVFLRPRDRLLETDRGAI